MSVLTEERPIVTARGSDAPSEADFATYIDRLRQSTCPNATELVPFLSVKHQVYSGRLPSTATRMRAYAVAAFHDIGLPDAAVPYLVEILETSTRPMLVGAAARAIRGAEAPQPQLANHLVHVIYSIWQNDQPVSFERYYVTWPLASFSTGLTEVFGTLSWMGCDAAHVRPMLDTMLTDFSKRFSPRSRVALKNCIDALATPSEASRDCCTSLPRAKIADENWTIDLSQKLDGVFLEDQDGQTVQWCNYFKGKPSVVVFFYATCRNPRKCVQTIYNLLDIRRKLTEAGLDGCVRMAAITYEPRRDTADVLKQYGLSRKATFDANFKFLRVPTDFEKVIQNFRLGVNYINGQVNDHQIELYTLDSRGDITRQFIRLQANPEVVANHLIEIAAG